MISYCFIKKGIIEILWILENNDLEGIVLVLILICKEFGSFFFCFYNKNS